MIKYGAVTGGSTAGFFETSNMDTYQRLWQGMSGTFVNRTWGNCYYIIFILKLKPSFNFPRLKFKKLFFTTWEFFYSGLQKECLALSHF